jgi:hypothetical protein
MENVLTKVEHYNGAPIFLDEKDKKCPFIVLQYDPVAGGIKEQSFKTVAAARNFVDCCKKMKSN